MNIRRLINIPSDRKQTSRLFYTRERGFELGTTENKFSWRLGHELNSGPLDCSPSALSTWPRCLLKPEPPSSSPVEGWGKALETRLLNLLLLVLPSYFVPRSSPVKTIGRVLLVLIWLCCWYLLWASLACAQALGRFGWARLSPRHHLPLPWEVGLGEGKPPPPFLP